MKRIILLVVWSALLHGMEEKLPEQRKRRSSQHRWYNQRVILEEPDVSEIISHYLADRLTPIIKNMDESKKQKMLQCTQRTIIADAPEGAEPRTDAKLHEMLALIYEEMKVSNNLSRDRLSVERETLEEDKEQGKEDNVQRRFDNRCTCCNAIIALVIGVLSTNVVSNVVTYYTTCHQ